MKIKQTRNILVALVVMMAAGVLLTGGQLLQSMLHPDSEICLAPTHVSPAAPQMAFSAWTRTTKTVSVSSAPQRNLSVPSPSLSSSANSPFTAKAMTSSHEVHHIGTAITAQGAANQSASSTSAKPLALTSTTVMPVIAPPFAAAPPRVTAASGDIQPFATAPRRTPPTGDDDDEGGNTKIDSETPLGDGLWLLVAMAFLYLSLCAYRKARSKDKIEI